MSRTSLAKKIATQYLSGFHSRNKQGVSLPSDFYLIRENRSSGYVAFFILRLETFDRGPRVAMHGRIYIEKDSSCGHWKVDRASAYGGLGPVLYDAAMENISPGYLMPDSSPSASAMAVWEFYLNNRQDVERLHKGEVGDRCLDTSNPRSEATEYLYRKKPGSLSSQTIPLQDFVTMPAVIDHLGEPWELTFNSLEASVADYTPKVPGEW